MSIATTQTIADRIEALDWAALTAELDEDGFVQTPPVLGAAECRALGASFEEGRFRSTIDMRRYRFGEGEYKYFDAPLPELVDDARHAPTRPWRRWPTTGRIGWGSPRATRSTSRPSWTAATAPGSGAR